MYCPKLWCKVSENLKSLSSFWFGPQHKNVLFSCQCPNLFFIHTFAPVFCNCAQQYFFFMQTVHPTSGHPILSIHRHAFILCAVCFSLMLCFVSNFCLMFRLLYFVISFCLFTLNVFDLVLIYGNNRVSWGVDPQGLSPTFCVSNIYFTQIFRFPKSSTAFIILFFMKMQLIFLSLRFVLSLYWCYLWFESQKTGINKPTYLLPVSGSIINFPPQDFLFLLSRF